MGGENTATDILERALGKYLKERKNNEMYLVLNPPHMQQYIICVLNRKVIHSLVNMRGKNGLHLEKISDAVLSFLLQNTLQTY